MAHFSFSAPFKRRTFLKAGAGLALPALINPSALASSGELDLMMWSDYLPDSFIDAFTARTGIRINFTGIGSNEEILNWMRASKGAGFDLVPPTLNGYRQWEALGLLQPFDMKRVPIDKVNPAMALGETYWNFGGRGVHWLPHVWGTEGIAWRTDRFTPANPFPSYYDVWDEANAGRTMGRSHSLMLGLGLALERRGELEHGSVWAAYEDVDRMRAVWSRITEAAIARRRHIRLFWDDADMQKTALTGEDIVLAQTWDGPPIALKTAGAPVMYRAPVEGAMTWVDGLSLSATARNIDQVYAFIEAAYDAELAGEAIKSHGYNSPVIGADRFGGEVYARNFAEAYPGDSLSKLNAWPAETPWYVALRTEFVNRFLRA